MPKNIETKPNDETSGSEGVIDSKIDLQLRRYSTVLGYLQYENSTYWTRSQLFLVANATLFGFIIKDIPLVSSVSWSRLYTLLLPAIGGLLLSLFWLKTLKAVDIWINYWIKILIDLEPIAFGNLNVFRTPPISPKPDSIKHISLSAVRLFITLWSLTILYLIFVSFVKFINWEIC